MYMGTLGRDPSQPIRYIRQIDASPERARDGHAAHGIHAAEARNPNKLEIAMPALAAKRRDRFRSAQLRRRWVGDTPMMSTSNSFTSPRSLALTPSWISIQNC
tara:strand:- start:32707 stop:33015 length:309 start_codon:yes stop_codon:yes gene_type:complete